MPGYSARPPAIPTILIDDAVVRVTRWDFEPGAATVGFKDGTEGKIPLAALGWAHKRTPEGRIGPAVKAVFDRIVAAIALVVLAPLMLLVALAVKLESRGPVLFRQPRHGFNNELINVYKFRSMYTDMADIHATKQVTRDDPRVTRVGRFIRKTSIDELPQLFNVLRGELSLVGPRPHATQTKVGSRLYQEVVDGYYARHRMKPGITGWAQINGWRGEIDSDDKIRYRTVYDLHYIENWSLLLDLRIILRTLLVGFSHPNAY